MSAHADAFLDFLTVPNTKSYVILKPLWTPSLLRHQSCEFKGCNDITLAKVSNPTSPTRTVQYTRVTTASMPNLVPTDNPLQVGFLGDYMWVAVDPTGAPAVVWADTWGLEGTFEEDIYFAQGGRP